MEQITINDIKRDYARQIRANADKARSIESLEQENAKLTRQLGKFRRAQLAEYRDDRATGWWKLGFLWGMVSGAVLATAVYILAMNIAFA